ncbi:MAG: polysaccharide deacetylase family protein [Coriobacteriia bacterium]|nr:polysaccharide deacetylase family protein [Coriobacteriia bacterium]
MTTHGKHALDPQVADATDENTEETWLDEPTQDAPAWEPSAAAFGEGYAQVSAAKAIHRPTGKNAKEAKRRAKERRSADEQRKAGRAAQLEGLPAISPAEQQMAAAKRAAATASHEEPKPKKSRKGVAVASTLVMAALAVGGGAYGYHWYRTHPVTIQLNGEALTVQDEQRTIQGLLDNGVVELSAGNYLAIDGSVLKKHGGESDWIRLNGSDADTAAYEQLLDDGDKVEVKQGKDVTEESTVEDQVTIPHTTKVEGWGAIHWYAQGNGKDGSKGVTTGKDSGMVIDDVIEEPQDVEVVRYSANTKGKKVIALTFDDGPWPETTEAVLDVLKKNKAKATFFTIGNQISGREHMIKRMADEGHQICTHSYDHAAGSGQGVNITYMSRKEQRAEITKGMKAISDVTGQEASSVVRLPGGNVNEKTWDILSDLVTAEVNWDVDTMDWSRPGVTEIYRSIMRARGGDIILMHDGGGDRTQTVKALKKALPALKKKGYEFVTMDQLLKDYPAK